MAKATFTVDFSRPKNLCSDAVDMGGATLALARSYKLGRNANVLQIFSPFARHDVFAQLAIKLGHGLLWGTAHYISLLIKVQRSFPLAKVTNFVALLLFSNLFF